MSGKDWRTEEQRKLRDEKRAMWINNEKWIKSIVND